MNIFNFFAKQLRLRQTHKLNKKLLKMIKSDKPEYRIGRSDSVNSVLYVFKNFVIKSYHISDGLLGLYTSYSVMVNDRQIYSFAIFMDYPLRKDADVKAVLALM